MSDLVTQLISIALMTCIGYFVSKHKIIVGKQKDGIASLLNRLVLPAMLISTFTKITITPHLLANVPYVIVAALLVITCNYLVSKKATQKLKLAHHQASVIITGMVHSNVVFLAFPLVLAIYGVDGIFYATIYWIVDSLILFTFGVKRLSKDVDVEQNIPEVTIALIIGFIIMIFSNITKIPLNANPVFDAINAFAMMTTPLAFMFMGIIIAENKMGVLIKNKLASQLLIFKMLILPLFIIILFYLSNIHLESMVIAVIAFQIIMPPFSSLLPMSFEYKKDVKLAGSLIIIGHLMSIMTIPVLYLLVAMLFQ